MGEILGCIECGAPVSSKASNCPHCYTEYPLGVICLACCHILKESEAVKYESSNRLSMKYFHATCYQQVMHRSPTEVDSEAESIGISQETNRAQRKRKNRQSQATRAEFARQRQEVARLRAASGSGASQKIIQFLLLAIFAFLLWGVMLSLLFGDVGFVVGLVLAVLIAIPGLKQV